MFYPESFGTAPFALSVLDGGLTGVGSSAALVLDEVITAARIADARGYARFWMSEHHAMPGASIASPPLMAARLVGETHRIRLGAGGVMLPNHAPLAIAEQFGMLEALAPGRIDLGVGRAPGTDHTTAAALRRHGSANEQFPQQMQELIAFLNDDPSAAPVNVHAVPGPWQEQQNATDAPALPPELWILGSSLAAQLEELHSITDADELMLVTGSHGVGARSTTLELIADHYGAGDSRHS